MKKILFKKILVLITTVLIIQSIASAIIVSANSNIKIIHWGYNGYNLGNTPSDFVDLKALSAGYRHALILREDGTVGTWGDDEGGRLEVPKGLKNVKAISAGLGESVALKEDGTVVTWGFSTIPNNLEGVKAISAGKMSYSGVVKDDGTVKVWGDDNEWGQLDDKAWLKDAVDIQIGYDHIVVLREDGTVVSWGKNTSGQTDVPYELNNVKAIAAGGNFSVALKKDGTVITWGRDLFGDKAVPVPEGLTNVKAISAGSNSVMALKEDGTVVQWGNKFNGQDTIPEGTVDVKLISAGSGFSLAFTHKQDYAPPTGVKGVSPTELGGNDGRIVGINTLMEYRKSTDSNYKKVTRNEIRGLSAGTYYVRNAEIPGHTAGEDAVVVVADEASTDGYTYLITGSTATITGYTGSESDISIPAYINGYRVTSIGESAFERNDVIRSVTFPRGLRYINSYIFYGNTKIKSLSIPRGVISIGSLAFSGMTGLTDVWFYGDAPFMGERVFGSYNNYLDIYFDYSRTSYGYNWYGFESKPFNPDILTDICDVDVDDSIDIKDLALVALNYNIKSNDSNWNLKFDLNKDNIIDLYDLVSIAKKIR